MESAKGEVYGKKKLGLTDETTLERTDLGEQRFWLHFLPKSPSDFAINEFTDLINRICNTARQYGVQTWDDLTAKWKHQVKPGRNFDGPELPSLSLSLWWRRVKHILG